MPSSNPHPQECCLPISPEGRLKSILLSESRDIGVLIVYGICAGLFSLIIPIAVQSVVNTISFGSMMQPVFVLTLIVFVILGFAGLMKTLQSFVMEIVQQRIFTRIAIDLALRLPRIRIDVYDANQGSELVNRFFDVLIVQKSAAIVILDGIAILLQSSLGMILLAFYHPYLLALDVLLIGLMLFVFLGLGRNAVGTSIEESKAKYSVAAWLEELARNPIAFKAYGGPQYALLRSDELTTKYVQARKRHFHILLKQIIGSLSIQIVTSSLLLGLGGWLVIRRQLTLGQLVAAELVVTTVVAGFAKFGKYLENYYDLVAAADKLGHLLDIPLERTRGEPLPPSTEPMAVALRQVSFQYPNKVQSLHHISLEVEPGTRVAILGDNGSGKSTLTSILFGLRDPDTGHVEVDGMDLREVQIEKMRSQIGFVRGIEVFDGTILENVRMNRPEIHIKNVRDTLDSLGLLENITALPDGLFTRLSGSQSPLSAGQMQRLMLARAIVGKPRLLLLDESLDNIDEGAHDKVISVLFDRQASWTLLLTTHNEEIVDFCDRVYFLSQGKMTERTAPSWIT